MWRKKFPFCTRVSWSDKCCQSYSSFGVRILRAEMFCMFAFVHRWISLARIQTATADNAQGCESWLAAQWWLVFVGRNWWQGLIRSRNWRISFHDKIISEYTQAVAKTTMKTAVTQKWHSNFKTFSMTIHCNFSRIPVFPLLGGPKWVFCPTGVTC